MKAILMSIRPQWVVKILNGEKTIEVRKHFPKDYVGWVYIYCTKNKTTTINLETLLFGNPKNAISNRKVVARFWCDKVEEIKWDYDSPALSKYITQDLDEWELGIKSCLTGERLIDYLGKENSGYAIHITKLEPFDKPKEIKEFKTHLGCNKTINCMFCKYNVFNECTRPIHLTRAPQSWCYVEIGD